MKSKIKSVLIAITVLSVFGYFLVMQSCKNPVEGLVVSLNTQISENSIAVQVIDANPKNPAISAIAVKFSGKDASLVYGSDGMSVVKPVGGVFSLILRPGIKPTQSNPIEFNIEVVSSGFMKTVYPVKITKIGSKFVQVGLINIVSPPAGVSVKQQDINVPAGGLTSPVTIDIPLAAGKQETAKVTIPTGTKMLDENGAEMTGTLSASFLHFDNRTAASLSAFPGGFKANNILDGNGNPMSAQRLSTIGFVSLEIVSGAQKVKSFSSPVDIAIEINPTSINPKTNAVYKEGDSLSAQSNDADKNQWQIEQGVALTKNTNTNKLEGVIKVPHLSVWSLGFVGKFEDCVGTILDIQSNFSNGAMRYFEILDVSNAVIQSGLENIQNGGTIELKDADPDALLTINIYSGISESTKGRITGTFGPASFCSGRSVIKIDEVPHPDVTIDFIAQCPGKDGNQQHPNLDLFYRESETDPWSYFGTMVNGHVVTNTVELGHLYWIMTVYGGTQYMDTYRVTGYYITNILNLPSGSPGC